MCIYEIFWSLFVAPHQGRFCAAAVVISSGLSSSAPQGRPKRLLLLLKNCSGLLLWMSFIGSLRWQHPEQKRPTNRLFVKRWNRTIEEGTNFSFLSTKLKLSTTPEFIVVQQWKVFHLDPVMHHREKELLEIWVSLWNLLFHVSYEVHFCLDRVLAWMTTGQCFLIPFRRPYYFEKRLCHHLAIYYVHRSNYATTIQLEMRTQK